MDRLNNKHTDLFSSFVLCPLFTVSPILPIFKMYVRLFSPFIFFFCLSPFSPLFSTLSFLCSSSLAHNKASLCRSNSSCRPLLLQPFTLLLSLSQLFLFSIQPLPLRPYYDLVHIHHPA
ncbi:hypothetical protein K457DRAFT_1417273 [Linnemannia elongata AG-77]|uniref:Uncharacterized protein n=1 Tax=Linnemannia elongata AG-77 TaxID=1314771 RepID=A0A197JVR6_9FUNG|nr:hypothetical protein K457DRAFT_1417273 [Linnemannia elongata AG-77]